MTKESIKTYSYRISQASRTEIIVIMYDMICEYVSDARECMDKNEKTEFCSDIKQAKRVLDELITALDMQYDISRELYNLYMYCGKILTAALASYKTDELDLVINTITRLRKSFYELSKDDTSGPMLKNSQQVYAGLTYSGVGAANETSEDPVANRGFRV